MSSRTVNVQSRRCQCSLWTADTQQYVSVFTDHLTLLFTATQASLVVLKLWGRAPGGHRASARGVYEISITKHEFYLIELSVYVR